MHASIALYTLWGWVTCGIFGSWMLQVVVVAVPASAGPQQRTYASSTSSSCTVRQRRVGGHSTFRRGYNKSRPENENAIRICNSLLVAPANAASRGEGTKGPTNQKNLSKAPPVGDNRIPILLAGWLLGYLTFMPNGLMADSGTARSILAARIGLTASALFVVGGICGAIFNLKRALLPGLICQILALVVLGSGDNTARTN